MTETVFLAIHDIGSVNQAVTFNINYDQVGTTVQGTITGFTATINANYNGLTQDITDILLQIDRAQLDITGQTVVLNVITRSVHNGSGNRFIYFSVTPVTINIPGSNPSGFTSISFTPIINNVLFRNSDYNPFISNAIEGRSSVRLMTSDRNETTIQPQNSASLFSTSASKAQVNDSLYYDTGWSNARYNGSETSANDFGGIEPAILGRSFRGEVFTTSTTNQIICSQSAEERIIEDLLHTGPGELPDFVESNSTIILGSTGITSDDQTLFNYTKRPSKYTTDIPVVVGSIIKIEDEKMRVEKLLANNFMQVERGYLDTTKANHSENLTISSSAFTRLFNFEENNTKITVVDNSNVYIEDTRVVLGTDKFGVVYSKFECS